MIICVPPSALHLSCPAPCTHASSAPAEAVRLDPENDKKERIQQLCGWAADAASTYVCNGEGNVTIQGPEPRVRKRG